MQFKLLQFYKVLSNFSTSLISAFVPLLIYQQTGKIYLSVLCLVLQNAFEAIFTILLKNFTYKKPQIALMLRLIPIVVMQVLLLFLAKSPWIAVIGCAIFTGLNYALKYTPSDIIFAYATPPDAKTSTLALTRVFEQLGYVLASVVGGTFLDFIDYSIVIAISLGLYFISSLPLMIFYIKNRKVKNFNNEVISDAANYFENKVKDGKGKKVCKKITLRYCFVSALTFGADIIYLTFIFIVYLSSGSFLLAGFLNALFEGLDGFFTMILGKLDEKYDLTYWAMSAIILMGICAVIMSFTAGSVLSFVCFELIAVLWSFSNIYIYQRMLVKSKILGITNELSYNRRVARLYGGTIACAFGFIGAPFIALASGIMLIVGGAMVPSTEEKTRQLMVDYLENNEIAD